MEDSVSIQSKNGVVPPAAVLAGAERREAERSEADRSGEPAKIAADPAPAGPPRPNPEVVADAKRRTFTAEYKLRIIKAADAAKGSGGVGALLRREGLFSSHLTTWRKERQTSLLQALAPKTRGPKSKRDPQSEEMQKLRQENQRLTESLRRAEIVIDVQKKVGALLGWPLPPADPGETR
jgi:transposase